MPEAPKLLEPLFWDYTRGCVVLPRRRRSRLAPGMKRRLKKDGLRCMDCGTRCEWRRTKRGRFALWSGTGWHWWVCPKQGKFRFAYDGQRSLAAGFARAIEKE